MNWDMEVEKKNNENSRKCWLMDVNLICIFDLFLIKDFLVV